MGGSLVTNYFPDETINDWVDNDAQWMGSMPLGGTYIGIDQIHNDDGSIVQESQCVMASDVPAGLLYRFVNEPAFYV